MAGDAIKSRCVFVIRGIKIPFVVDVISSNEDASGVSVPMPALPVDGNVFVCATVLFINNIDKRTVANNVMTDFMLQTFF